MVLFVYNRNVVEGYNLISLHKRHRKKYDIRVLYIYYIGLLSGFLRLLTLYISILGYAIHVLRRLSEIVLLLVVTLFFTLLCYTVAIHPWRGEERVSLLTPHPLTLLQTLAYCKSGYRTYTY